MVLRLLATFAVLATIQAATLERLSLDDMTAKSSDIVRARVVSTGTILRGSAARGMVYTTYTLDVSERLKGPSGKRMTVAVPGGSTVGLTQTIAGSPVLKVGDEYVFFVWTSRSGLAQIIGLSQGLFSVLPDSKGALNVSRSATPELMLDPVTGKAVADTAVRYGYQELKSLVESRLAGRASQ